MRRLFTTRSLLSLTLLYVCAAALISALRAGVDGVENAAFFPVAFTGITITYLLGLGISRMRRIWWIPVIGGILIVFIEAGRLHDPLLELIRLVPRCELDLLRSLFTREPFETPYLGAQVQLIASRAGAFLARLTEFAGPNSKPALMREALWDIPLYLLGTWSGWWTARRRQAFTALVPSLALHGYILYVTKADALSLMIATAVFVILLGINQRWSEIRQRNENADRSSRETFSAVLVLSLVIVVAAAFTPSISVKQIVQDFAGEDPLGEAFGLNREVAKNYALSGLPRQHLVGLDPAISRSLVFTVRTGEIPSQDKEVLTQQVPRHYWRWLTYDIYNGQGWATSPVEADKYSANEALFNVSGTRYKLIHQEVLKAYPEDNRLYWTGSLVRANQPFETTWRVSVKSLEPGIDPMLMQDMLGALTEKSAYSVDSLVPLVGSRQLQTSPTTYPQVIRERYLALPPSVTERTLHLAEELTRGLDNPYDKAKAIEAYLRTYPYSLEIPAPPPDRDVADYFLFDLKVGYCDYYATAMAVLARAAGLPARLVIGYASGEYDPMDAAYNVHEADAHSWVEVYFTGIGWVEFEPTAGEPLVTIPTEILDEESTGGPSITGTGRINTSFEKRGYFSRRDYSPYLFSLLIVSTFAVLWFLRTQGLLRGHRSIGSIYRYVFQLGKQIHKDAPIHETPSAFAGSLKGKMHGGVRMLLPAGEEIDLLTSLYLKESYSPHPITGEERRQAVKVWRKLFWRLVYAQIILRS